MEHLTKRITEWLIVSKAVEATDRELYEYAIYSMLITISPLFLVMVIGILMGTLVEGVFLIIPFMCIRKFSGGYHAKTFKICFVSSCGLLILCMYLASHINYGFWVSALLLVSVISLSLWSPIDSENRRLEQDEKIKYRRTTIWISLVFTIIHFALLLMGYKYLAVSIAVGLMLSAGLQLPCVIQLFRTESKELS